MRQKNRDKRKNSFLEKIERNVGIFTALCSTHTLYERRRGKTMRIKESFSELCICRDEKKEDAFIFVSYWP